MKKKIIKLVYLSAIFFSALLAGQAHADTISLNASAINGIRNCGISEGFFTAPQSATISDISESIGWFNNPSGSVISYLMTSSSEVMASTTISPSQGSYIITTSTFSNSPAIVSGQTYRFCYTPTVGDILNVEGDTTAPIIITIAEQPPTPTTTLSFIYPTNGSSVAPFSNFLLTAANTIPADYYKLTLVWDSPTNGGQVQERKTYGHTITSNGFTIPRLEFVPPANTTTTITANARLYRYPTTYDYSAGTITYGSPILEATSSITFDMGSLQTTGNVFNNVNFGTNASGTITFVPSINGTYKLPDETNSTSTNAFNCEYPPDGAGVGAQFAYGFCKVGAFFLKPNPDAAEWLTSSIDQFKGVFPFAYIFGLTNALQQAAIVAQNATSSDFLTMTLPMIGSGINVLSPTIIEDVAGADFKSWFFTFQKRAVWLAVLILIISIIR